MLRLLRPILLLLAAAFICGTVTAAGTTPAWEPVKTERPDAKTVAKETDIEIKAAPSTIFISANKPVQIKVFTILGRLVNSENLPSGSLKLTLPAHGVYIVKVGELTCKVAI